MNCQLLTAADFAASGYAEYVRNHLTRDGSDFQRKLGAWLGGLVPAEEDGHIALVIDHGEVIGWARTEYWTAGSDGAGGFVTYDTLEAFTHSEYRLRGIAAFAAAGLYAGVLHDNGCTVAVFSPHMLLVARRAGFFATLFTRNEAGQWVLE